jgi:hypothetical protein
VVCAAEIFEANWTTVPSLCRKYKKALKGLAGARQAYDALAANADDEVLRTWSEAEENAQSQRAADIKSMDIFDVHFKQGTNLLFCHLKY